MKRYRITIEYDLFAISKYDAEAQVFNQRVEPESVDVLELPVYPTPKIDIIDF